MRTVFIDHINLLRSIAAVSSKDGILDVIEDNSNIIICEVDDAGYEGLMKFGIPFTGGKQEVKKATKKSSPAPVEKKKLTSNNK